MSDVIRWSISFIGAVVVPVFLIWLDLTLTHGKGFQGAAGYASWGLGMTIALASIILLPISKQARWLIGILYIPTASVGLFSFALGYACLRFHNCL